MNTKHTPGPWKVTVYPSDEGGQDLCAYVDSTVAGQQRKPIAHVFCEQDLSLRDANAALIAAAPELLEALRQVTMWLPVAVEFGGLGEDSSVDFSDKAGKEVATISIASSLELARATIAKATGGAS